MNDFDKLELSTETIRELTAAELGRVAGGGADQQSLIPTCMCTGYYPSINAPCVTVQACIEDTFLCHS